MSPTLLAQAGVLRPPAPAGRHLLFSVAPGATAADLRSALGRLSGFAAEAAQADAVVVGLGPVLLAALGVAVPGLREFPMLDGTRVAVPATPMALWCWLRGGERGELVLRAHALERLLAPALAASQVLDTFMHRVGDNGLGRDLTGYEDGTENPEGEAAEEAALVRGAGAGLDGGSHVAVQQWVHDYAAFEALSPTARDLHVGRRLADNEEIDDAPASAHVKRTAQESFDPEAFVLRRSMPWADGRQSGLLFVAFGRSHDAYEAQMRRMAGLEDGVVDALFDFSRPVTGSYFWCPPLGTGGRLDLRRLGL